jgi:type II secretory pathway predicted ATPase ExeA
VSFTNAVKPNSEVSGTRVKLPRALNNAAVAALIAAAAAGKDLIDDACAKKAVTELTRD